jgi:hypothetical protein
MVSTLVIQGNWKELLDMLRYKSKPGGTADKSNNQGNRSSQNNFLLGVIPCLGATLLSGLAGAFLRTVYNASRCLFLHCGDIVPVGSLFICPIVL